MMVCLIQKNRKIGVLTVRVAGEKIKTARKRKKLSQAELAKGICTQATISNIENKMCVTV